QALAVTAAEAAMVGEAGATGAMDTEQGIGMAKKRAQPMFRLPPTSSRTKAARKSLKRRAERKVPGQSVDLHATSSGPDEREEPRGRSSWLTVSTNHLWWRFIRAARSTLFSKS